MSYTTVMYMGINLRSGQKEEHDAAGWAKILGLNTNQIAEIARGNVITQDWQIKKSRTINNKTGMTQRVFDADFSKADWRNTIDGMAAEAKRRGISYGELQAELYAPFTHIIKPIGLKTQREKNEEKRKMMEAIRKYREKKEQMA